MGAKFGKICRLVMLLMGIATPSLSYAGFDISPYVSVRSTKSVRPDKKNKSNENETIKQRNEAGIKASLSFWRLFKLGLGVGQSKLTTTEKVSQVKDEYGDIDMQKDLNMSTDDPEASSKITETQNVARFNLMIDPSFWIFIVRAKIGVTAMQRIIESEITGQEKQTLTDGPKYKPNSGLGLGVRLSPKMYFIAEYSAYHYKFPEIEPFERELSVSFNVSL